MKRKLSSSLAHTTLLSMGIRISIVVIVIALLSYLHIINNLEQQTLDKLEKYITERAAKESSIFKLAQDNHQIFRKRFLRLWPRRKNAPSQARFDALFEPSTEGTYLLKQAAFDGLPRPHSSDSSYMGESRWISGFIGKNTPVNDNNFQNRLLLSYDLIDHFAEGWSNRFANTYVSLPEGVNIVYWPELNWAAGATVDLDIPKEEWVYIANKENDPERKSVWTGLYYDQTADEWMVSCETPVDDNSGQHLINIGHDILLNKLFDRVFNDHLEGAYNFIFRKDGRLIAHPSYVNELRRNQGVLHISEINSDELEQQYAKIMDALQNNGEKAQILDKHVDKDAFIAVAPIDGPDWYFVTIYPKTLLSSPAKMAAEYIFMLGVISLVIELIMLYLVLQKKVIQPLRHFKTASNAVSLGDYQLRPIFEQEGLHTRQDEVGQLCTAFLSMADQVHDYNVNLEEKVRARTEEAELARRQAEEQARTDPLTGLPNRRAFFEFAQYAVEHAKRHQHNLTVIMLDIDHFKNINDNYGHAMGDEVLKCLAKVLKESLRPSDLTARLGGEEFAILLNGSNILGGINVAEKLRQVTEKCSMPAMGNTLSITASFGVAQLDSRCTTIDELLKRADTVLYEAKAKGRNQVKAYQTDEGTPLSSL